MLAWLVRTSATSAIATSKALRRCALLFVIDFLLPCIWQEIAQMVLKLPLPIPFTRLSAYGQEIEVIKTR